MRYSSIVLSLLLVFPAVVAGDGLLTPRPVDPTAVEIFERAIESSDVVRSLVATLASSNVIVHIQTSRQMPLGIGGMTRFVTSRGGYRYVRITIAFELSKTARTAILAHELQHACEVAESGAGDTGSLRKVFTAGGYRTGEFFETDAALRIERIVREELRESRYNPNQ